MITQEDLRNRAASYRPVTVSLFAWGLRHPSHMEWTPDGRLLVSEHTQGTIKEITHGGDVSQAKPFAYGLRGPASIMPLSDGRILVAETWGGRVAEISRGGDVSRLDPVAVDLATPYTLARFGEDHDMRLFVSERPTPFRSQVTELILNGSSSTSRPFVVDMPARLGEPGLTPPESWPDNWEYYAAAGCTVNWVPPSPVWDEHLYIAVGSVGQVLKVKVDSGGGRYVDVIDQGGLLARELGRLGGMHFNPADGLIYAVQPELGSVIALDPSTPRNYRFSPPVVQGLRMPTCVRFTDEGNTMLVCSIADGVVWRVTDYR